MYFLKRIRIFLSVKPNNEPNVYFFDVTEKIEKFILFMESMGPAKKII